MLTKELKSLIKLSEKRGKFDYYDGLMYYMLAHRVRPEYLFGSLICMRKVNKLISKPVGRMIFKDNVEPISINSSVNLNSCKFNIWDSKTERNYMYLAGFQHVIHLLNGLEYKLPYKMAIPQVVYTITRWRLYNSLDHIDTGIDCTFDVARDLVIRDEEIIRSILSQIPDNIYPLIDRRFDLPKIDNRVETDINYEYIFESDEVEYLSKNFGNSKSPDFDDFTKLMKYENDIVHKWLFSKYDTIKEYLESGEKIFR